MHLMNSPLPTPESLYVLRGKVDGRPYVAAVFSELTSAVNYMRRTKRDLVLETTPNRQWPLYVVEFLNEEGEWSLDYVNREGLLSEIEETERYQGDHVYMMVYKVPCDWLGHPRDLGSNFMDKLKCLSIDNWFLEAYDDAGPESFDWF